MWAWYMVDGRIYGVDQYLLLQAIDQYWSLCVTCLRSDSLSQPPAPGIIIMIQDEYDANFVLTARPSAALWPTIKYN
jgi:hypothetical protein